MVLTPEEVAIGRRNFIKAMAGVPPLLAFGAAAALRGPVRGGPVKAGFIGPGSQGKVLLGQVEEQRQRRVAVDRRHGHGRPDPRRE